MSKLLRPFATLALCTMATLSASAALAAPSLTLTVPAKEITGASSYVVTVKATEPGFLTMTLSKDGAYVATLVEHQEIHTKENELELIAADENDEAFAPGAYTVTAVMVDQFGTASAEVSKDISFKEAPVEETKEVETATTSSTTSSGSTAAAAPSATATPVVTETLTYSAGTAKVGAEGYEIGVGVSDADKTAKGYWALSSSSTDAEIWAAMQEKMTAANVGENEVVYIYDSTSNGKKLGSIAGTSQGFNVLAEVGNWSLVEAFRLEDGAFVRGYIRTNKLRTVEPNPTYGLLIDKNTQTLTVFKDGARIGSTKISTGLATPKSLLRETPAGEFITVTRRGTIEYYGNGYTKYTVRIAGNYHLCEIPTTKRDGKDFSMLEGTLGQKATRGNIVLAHDASTDGGINAEWIWNLTDENKRIKVLILDDKDRSDVPVSSK